MGDGAIMFLLIMANERSFQQKNLSANLAFHIVVDIVGILGILGILGIHNDLPLDDVSSTDVRMGA